MESYVVTPQVMLDRTYIASLNVPEFNCDRGNKDHLKFHLLCSALCAPRQIADDETVSATNAHNNMCQVSRNSLDFYTVGRLATQSDRVEMERIDSNVERLFQLPPFNEVFEMDINGKFKPVPPQHLKPLYNRIVRSGQWLRRKDGVEKVKKESEYNAPEAVYKCKVACNFLLELIEEERMEENRCLVDWQSIQARYQEMFANEKSKDRRLMDLYKSKFNLEFSQPNLNSELIKSWTGRSSIKKALSMSVFNKISIQTEENTGVLRVGFEDNTSLYSDEELTKAAEAAKAAASERHAYEQRKLRNEGASTGPTVMNSSREHQVINASSSLLPHVDSTLAPSLTTFQQARPGDSITLESMLRTQQQGLNANEPQYIPSSDTVDAESTSTYSESENSEAGVFTDDEDAENNPPMAASKNDVPPCAPLLGAQQLTSTNITNITLSKSRGVPVAVRQFYPKQEVYLEESVKSVRNPWERSDEPESAIQDVLSRREKNFSVEERYVTLSCPPLAQTATSSQLLPRHASAFAACKGSKNPSKENIANEVALVRPSSGSGNNTQAPVPVSAAQQSGSRSFRQTQSELVQQGQLRQIGNVGERVPERLRENPGSVTQKQLPYTDLPHTSPTGNPGNPSSSKEADCRVPSSAGIQQSGSRSRQFADIHRLRQNGCQSVPPKGQSPPQGSVFLRRIDKSFFRPRSEVPVEKNTEEPKRDSCNAPVNSEEKLRDNTNTNGLLGKDSVCSTNDYYNGDGNTPQKINTNVNSADCQSSSPVSRSSCSTIDPLDSFRERHRKCSRSDGDSDYGSDKGRRNSRPLTADQESRLRMIREYTFMYRNVNDLGFHCLHSVMDILPPDNSVDWIKLIRERLPEVEVFPFRDKYILIWKAGTESDRVSSGN